MKDKNGLKTIIMPPNYNYIAAFLTFACNLRCSYCINYFEQSIIKRKIISGKDWITGLNRIISRPDLPITLQGGEPSLHPDFIYIINNIKPGLKIDILSNLQFDTKTFIKKIDPNRIKRESPYASIRVSYHPETMNLDLTIKNVLAMMEKGFSVGIWGVMHPKYENEILYAQDKCKKNGIDFRIKEFLGEHDGRLHGTYRYEGACGRQFSKRVQCKTTELLIDSEGKVFRCHSNLYKGIHSIGSIADPDFEIQDIFRDCNEFGHCNPCDVKVKTNRFQQHGHTSVEIKLRNRLR